MTSQPERIEIKLTIPATQPQLLEGLDLWLRLGLLSETQVIQICRTHLVCALPVAEVSPQEEFITTTQAETPVPIRTRPAPIVSQILSSLMEEISVVWLLFLGVFMVVVSSGVLAASQWQNFSSVGQYAILFGYTLAFWFACWWTRQRPNLSLTSRILQVTTLSLIPVNFWAIDGFQLWWDGLGLIVGAIAILSLSAIAWTVLQAALPIRVNTLALSWLQLGWIIPGFPLIAIYSGTVGTAGVLWHRVEKRRATSLIDLGISGVVLAISTLLLFGRGVLRAGVPIDAIGLALGICGWVLCWLTRRQVEPLLTRTGIGLLVLGWIVAVSVEPPWQAIAVSILGIWLLANRLQRLWQVWDLLAIFFVGLQAYCLLWRLIPVAGRQQIIALATQIAGGYLFPGELIGLALFPYIIVTLIVSSRLRRASQPNLANHTEGMALILGSILALFSLFNPLVRSLYLLASTLTLIIVLRQRPTLAAWLIYLTHVTGILTLYAWIGWGFPNLNARFWAVILLIGMVAEWGCSLAIAHPIWQRSAWYIGLVLAGLSYPLLIASNPSWGLIWLATPACLTFLGSRAIPQARLANWLSVVALLLAQILTEARVTPLLISTAVATSLMLFNTQKLRSQLAAAITVGFGLSFAGTCLWQIWGVPLNWLPTWIGVALWGLWLLRSRRGAQLCAPMEIYALALDAWAIALSIINLTFLTLGRLEVYPIQDFYIIFAAVITTGAITYRNWQQPTNLGFSGIAWGTELVVASIVWWTVPSFINIAIANLGLGLATQLGGDWWVRRSALPYLSSWHVISLIYAVIGLIFAHYTFTAYTGLYTLAAALVGIGVGRRLPLLKPITFISVFGLSFAAYELLVYQLIQSKGGQAGDGIVLLSTLACAIAITYRFCSRWLLFYWRLTPQELLVITHLHWGVGSLFSLLALGVNLSNFGSNLWLAIAATLAAYAAWQGRNRHFWVYLSVIQLTITIAHLLNRILPLSALLDWSAAIACIFAYILYMLPWQTWGWSKQPWQRSATVLPGVIVLLTSDGISISSLFLVAAFYAWLARIENKIRLSYLSIVLSDWAIIRLIQNWQFTDPLWYVSVLSGSLLYVVQVDPTLRSPTEKEKRHILRTLAVGLFCLTALYQSDNSLWQGILTIFLGIGLILAGIVFRTRAYLYVGTLTFITKVLRQLWLFIDNYSLLLWAIGIVVGLLFIWIAATFEARRTQAIALMQTWIRELEAWE
ncbi:MAG: DUF2157 domain-containing protein [Chroococcidiopsis sp.]